MTTRIIAEDLPLLPATGPPKHRRFVRFGQIAEIVDRERASGTGTIDELLHLRFDRRGKAEIVENQRSQLRRDATRRRDGVAQEIVHPRELRHHVGIPSPTRSRNHTTIIRSVVSDWPSSSCNSRAIRCCSCSRA